ncbi:hypothetical protein CFC21_020925 [Triticum aestivum]|uniref:Exocyst subunit Exo70 family protein n=2 Tax=Triticum aestivum TaxID=4565 RepID=A0A3B6BXV0_WHEAT|nr:uncharacterized protein LOC119361827 isoform X1 [Triticum dicoccoides]XP_044321508.1 uncharacterized protein LOC123043202 isoform X1 [Triticum aestivum]KAF7005825.1 hypothetical protein CFC21_020925 [Triticum aestivum]
MADYAPPPEDQALELGPREPFYAALYLALALPVGLVAWVPAKARAVARWLSGGRLPAPVADGADPIRGDPPRRNPSLLELDLAQVAAAAAALCVAIVAGIHLIPSLVQRRADSSDSDSSGGDEEESGHHSDRHVWYPPIQSLETGDRRLFFPGLTASARQLPDARQGDDQLHRLSDVENPLILTPSTERFSGPCELSNETTRTWVMRLKITTKLVCLCKRQLHQQNQELAEECFAVVAKQSVEQILEVACSFSDASWSDAHISQQLTVFDALVDVLFNIQGLHFSGSGEVADIINKMVNAFKGVIQRTTNSIRSNKESIIHPATFILIQVLEFFKRNRDMIQPILETGGYNTGPCSDMLDCLVSKLKCAEKSFQKKGQRCIFFLNNINYVLQKNCHSGLLPPDVESNLVSLIDQYIMSYLEEYWVPLLRYLDGDSLRKPRRLSLDKFTGEFLIICDSQMTRKVQTVLKGRLRQEIVDLIVPKYVNFLRALEENPRSWFDRISREKPMYTVAELEQVIRGLFER